MSKLKLTASDIDACMSGPEVGPVDAGMIAEQALAAIELEAALAAAEAKLADSERACAGFVKMAADEMYRADAMAHALDQSPYMRARVKAQYVAARRAAEAANG